MLTHNERAIVVTGASTRIGKVTALHLDTLDFRVFASVRKEGDGHVLKQEASTKLRPIFLDVTDADSIEIEGMEFDKNKPIAEKGF